MIDVLLNRVVDARAVNRLSVALSEIKTEKNLKRRELRTTGTADEICESVRLEIQKNLITAKDLAKIVDELEENGAQHIFLFEAEQPDRLSKLIENIKADISAAPKEPTAAYYSNLPSTNRLYYEPHDDYFVTKLVGKTSYWKIDEDESIEEKARRVVVWIRAESRVVHLFLINPVTKVIEIRIQHASKDAPATHWETDLEDFLNRLAGIVSLDELKPIPIWRGFRKQIQNRSETYMTVDEAKDAVTNQRMSLRRQQGPDIRENDDYNLDEDRFARDTLRIYWKVSDEHGIDASVHTIQQRIQIDEIDVGKIWIPRRISSEVLNSVLARIRKYAA